MIEPEGRAAVRGAQARDRAVCSGGAGTAARAGRGTLSRLFTRNSLIVLEYLIMQEEDAVMPISELAKVLRISESSLISNCRKLIDEGILTEINYRTERSWAKMIRLNRNSEIVNDLVRAFRAVVESRIRGAPPQPRQGYMLRRSRRSPAALEV